MVDAVLPLFFDLPGNKLPQRFGKRLFIPGEQVQTLLDVVLTGVITVVNPLGDTRYLGDDAALAEHADQLVDGEIIPPHINLAHDEHLGRFLDFSLERYLGDLGGDTLESAGSTWSTSVSVISMSSCHSSSYLAIAAAGSTAQVRSEVSMSFM